MKKHAKELFFNNIEYNLNDLNSSNPKQYWKIVKMLVKNNTKSCETIPPLRKQDQSLSVSDVDKANVLNDYFVSISTIDDSHTTLPDFILKTNSSLNNIRITDREISDILLNLNVNKATGPDEISHRMLKETHSTICQPLCILFNRSMQENSYPNCWKLANVMPLFKKGDHDTPSNYRPISLISCVGKVMERVIFKHMYNFFHTNDLIFRNQSGFLPNHSTVFQLIDIYDQICRAFDEKKSTCIVFCDISKAFDRVWHRGLLFKLRQYGISGNLINWISNYLSNRSQRVFINSSFSETSILNAGVPQGSVLGPLLFLIYVNDIADSLLSTTRLFADDSSLAVSSQNIVDMETILNTDLSSITQWSKQWLVNFNPSKTEVMFFTLAQRDRPSLYFEDTPLSFVDHHKHLGLTFSHDGSWHSHIENIVNSASKVLGSMRMLKFKLKRQSLNQIYVSYLRPIIEYASLVWDNCTNYEKETLDKIQYEAARLVTGLTRSVSIERLLNEIGWVSLSDRRIIQKLILVYKEKQGNLPIYLHEIFPTSVQNSNPYNLRNNDDFQSIIRRTEIYSKSVIPSSIKLWNQLDIDIRNSPTLTAFKAKLKLHFKPPVVPKLYLIGDRSLSVYHSRIRNRCSNLNAHLHYNHLLESPSCECGFQTEDPEHYFFRCPRFANERQILFMNTRPYHPLNVQKLLCGNDNLTYAENEIIFKEVQTFIKNTHRFSA